MHLKSRNVITFSVFLFYDFCEFSVSPVDVFYIWFPLYMDSNGTVSILFASPDLYSVLC